MTSRNELRMRKIQFDLLNDKGRELSFDELDSLGDKKWEEIVVFLNLEALNLYFEERNRNKHTLHRDTVDCYIITDEFKFAMINPFFDKLHEFYFVTNIFSLYCDFEIRNVADLSRYFIEYDYIYPDML